MSETNRDDISIAEYPFLNLGVPNNGIDIRVILLALKYELPRQKICFGNRFDAKFDVVVPTLRIKFTTEPVNGFIIFTGMKKIKLPIKMDGEFLSEEIINILCAVIEQVKINETRF